MLLARIHKPSLHIWLLLFVALLAVACAEPAAPTPTPTVPPPENPLVGKWALSTGESLAFQFFESGTMLFTYEGREHPGKYETPQQGQIWMTVSGDLGSTEYLLTDVKVGNDKLLFVLDGTAAEMNRVTVVGAGAVAEDAPDDKVAGTSAESQQQVVQVEPIAIVNGQRIGLQDYQRQVRFSWFQQLQQGQAISDPQGSALEVLDQMIDLALLRQQAVQRGISVSEQEITTRIEEAFGFYRQTPTPFPTFTTDPNASPAATPVTEQAYNAEFKRYMDSIKVGTDMTEADWRKLIEADLLRQKLYENVTKDVATTSEQVRIRHILIAVITSQPAPRTDAEALQLAQEVKQKLTNGEDFAALATTYSDDTGSKTAGGELGWYSKGEGLVREFEDAAFSLDVGKISDPVLTQFGYHIIQVEEKDPDRELNAYTLYQKKQEAYDAWLTDLRSAAKIERSWTLDKVPPTPGVP